MYFAVIAVIVAIDQIVKYIVRTGLSLGEIIPVLGDFLTISLHYNTGAAFSMMEGYRMILTILPATLIIVLVVYIFIKRKDENKLLLLALSIIVGGGLGNLIDRILMGQVTDFISVGSFPVFNIADMCVVCGCGLVIIYLLFFDKKTKDTSDGAVKRN